MEPKKNTDTKNISKVQEKRKSSLTEETLVEAILTGDRAALARGITLVESTQAEHHKKANFLLEQCLAKKSDSIRIGITGVPGVGKSTFIEAFGKHLTSIGKKVAVLAIDPTSAQSKGSILGDKTRMNELVKDPNAFIRPSPSSESLGGVARKTRETMILCEAAGYNVILIETVGVGQSETAVHSMVDFFLLLKLAGAGDELQGIKRGIIEMADALVINKADGANRKEAHRAQTEFKKALHLYPPKSNGWIPKVLTCSALEKTGITEIWNMILEFVALAKKKGHFISNRKKQNQSWLLQTIDERLKQVFYSDPKNKKRLEELMNDVKTNKISPFQAAEKLLRANEKEKS
ncbi:methylmalonyl Co-A mutase-associated GTPase MeaB [Maribacter algicola]|uniref:Methylmalonyl Co-A mutase-associated GTPase MeaB n=1 Tax=Meishania litoralis TaxID=3434685 RepID=A0ACC7LEM0_9FLAO